MHRFGIRFVTFGLEIILIASLFFCHPISLDLKSNTFLSPKGRKYFIALSAFLIFGAVLLTIGTFMF